MLAATIGAGSVWIWMHSHVAWQNHLQRAFNSGLDRGWVGLDLDAQPCRLAKPFAAGLQQRP